MTQKAENSQWYKGKGRMMSEYINKNSGMLDVIAGRGFFNPPGFLTSAITDLEIDIKLKLSDLNYQIVSDAIERELRQAGIDYDLKYKAAAVAWEINKQGLISDWQKELAVIKGGQTKKEEELNQLAIEVALKEIILIEAKKNIEIEMEGYKKQIVEADMLSLDKEKELAEAKLTGAQKRLKLIPILYELLESERLLLESEQSLYPIKESLIDARNLLIQNKQQLIQQQNDKIAMREELNKVVSEEIVNQNGMIIKKTEYIKKTKELIPPELVKANKLGELADKKIEYSNKKMGLIVPELDKVTKLGELADKKIEYSDKKMELISPEMDKADKLGELADKKIEYSDKKMELISPELNKVTKLNELAGKKIEYSDKKMELISPELDKVIKLDELADKKIEYSNKKMELISPELDKVIKLDELNVIKADYIHDKDKLIDANTEKYEMLDLLTDENYNLADKTGELATPYNERISKITDLIGKIKDQIEFYKIKMELLFKKAVLDKEAVDKQVTLINSDKTIQELRLRLTQAMTALNLKKGFNQCLLEDKEASDTVSTTSKLILSNSTRLIEEKTNFDYIIDKKERILTEKELPVSLASLKKNIKSNMKTDVDITDIEVIQDKTVAAKNAMADVTSKLTHVLLGSGGTAAS